MAREKEIAVPAPRENPLLFGHEVAERRFLDEFARGQPHHAYLMSGSKGIGKATLAYRFARYVLSQKGEGGGADSLSLFGEAPLAVAPPADLNMSAEDPLFRRIAAGSHSDLMVLAPAFDTKKQVEKGEISAEEARAVPGFLSLTPAEGAWRVVVVDAVDQLNTHAANALLKILEEPPERAILFLICHEPGGILPTIRSRCRNFRLSAPGPESFERVLETVAPSIERADYAPLFALSYGSPGLAVTLAEQDALAMYEAWLKAMQPTASREAKAELVGLVAKLREPEAWAMFMHGWQVAMHRLSIYPRFDPAIGAREGEWLATIAASVPPELRQRWVTHGRQLLGATETFNLDKRETVRLMIAPHELDRLPSAA